MPLSPTSILLTGANGQLGTVLTRALLDRYPDALIIATDKKDGEALVHERVISVSLDVLDQSHLQRLTKEHRIQHLYHLAGILSANGEKHPHLAWQINMQGLLNVLEVARLEAIERVFFPSTIAVFGPDAPKVDTPNNTVMHPTTVYGIAKAAGENWCQYYYQHYGLDVRSLRYPGVIGWQSLPGGGTTDYAVEIFHHALKEGRYSCFLKPDTKLPMMYMDDAMRATLELMEAEPARISVRTSYNIAAISFTPAELALAIKRHIPDFQIDYAPDFRQQIADNWPVSIDDSLARNDWGWRHRIGLEVMVAEMITQLKR